MTADGIEVRPATTDELPAVCNVLDGSLLEIDTDNLQDAIGSDAVLVAVTSDEGKSSILGALVLDGREIVAIAVRRRRRGQGIGTALVEAARERRGRLVAAFDERVGPFWESLGFVVEESDEADRYRAHLPE